MEFSIAVGYSDSQISRLEQNMRMPDLPVIEARFAPALCLEDEPLAVARLMELAASVRREEAPALGQCPYKGLDYFDENDADLFVGREALSEKLIQRVIGLVPSDHPQQKRFFAIVGASGSGKSSLVRAGLIPSLRRNWVSASWIIRVLTPTVHPLESLAYALEGESSLANSAKLMDDLARDPRSLCLYIKHRLKASGGHWLLLVIDQFEELFAHCHSDSERTSLIDNLMTAASSSDSQAIIVIILRADFYPHCSGYPALREALTAHQEYIGAMSDDEMRRAIEEPALRGRWDFEPGLVDLILHDVGHEPGALPLLSHALFETWQRRHGRTLTLSGYNSAGGVRGAIAETAEAVFTDKFTPEQQAIARRIFIRLTELGDEAAAGDTARRVTFDELVLKPEESEATQEVLKALADARLITTSEDTVEVAHEALIREWPTLRRWLEENREGLRLHRQLTDASQEWLEAEREPGILFRGARLAQAREWSILHSEDMNSREREFLSASITASEAEVAEREAQHQRELEAAHKLAQTERQRAEEGVLSARRLRRRSILVSGMGILAVLLAGFAIFAWLRSASQAAINRSWSLAAAARQVYAAGRTDLALALALESVNLNQPPAEAQEALRMVALGTGTRAVLKGHHQEVRASAISPDGNTAFSGSCAQMDDKGNCKLGELILWDAVSGKEIRRWSAHSGWLNVVTFSSDGKTLVSGGADGTLLLWDLGGNQVGPLLGHSGSINDLVSVPKTNWLLSGSEDGYLILWDLATRYVLQRFAATNNPITAVGVAASLSTAVTAHQNGSIMLWDMNSREPVHLFKNQGRDIKSIALAPDGRWILFTSSATSDFNLRMISSLDGTILHQHLFACVPNDLSLSSELSFALITCTVNIIQMDIQNWSVQKSLTGQGEVFNTVSISHDGRMALTASKDGTLRLWNMGETLEYNLVTIDADILNAIDITSDGKYLLLSDAEKDGVSMPALWDIDQHKVVMTCNANNETITPGGVKISPDSRFIAFAGTGIYGFSLVSVCDRASGALIFSQALPPGNVRALAFSPDSQFLLVGTQAPDKPRGQLVLFSTDAHRIVLHFDTTEDISSIAFSSDGTRAISGSSFLGRVILWEVKTGKEIRRFAYADYGPISTVAFGPGDSTVFGAGLGGIYLWDVETGRLVNTYTGLTTSPWSVAVSPDGNYVLSGTLQGELVLWDFKTGEVHHRIDTHLGIYGVLFSPDGKTAYAAAMEGELIQLPIAEKPLIDLLKWIDTHRYVRPLTAEERLQYHVNP